MLQRRGNANVKTEFYLTADYSPTLCDNEKNMDMQLVLYKFKHSYHDNHKLEPEQLSSVLVDKCTLRLHQNPKGSDNKKLVLRKMLMESGKQYFQFNSLIF